MGRLINHSRLAPNLIPKKIKVSGNVTLKDIVFGEELRYDYEEEDRDVIKQHTWLRTT